MYHSVDRFKSVTGMKMPLIFAMIFSICHSLSFT
jgi:hypothetical protein